ncbi:MAG: hypothetical protein K2Y22_13540 [Candidatus Obscuribacterales bacterium]|nr:hypothetical protein [Candidatus Obscuribacterales bacterium]
MLTFSPLAKLLSATLALSLILPFAAFAQETPSTQPAQPTTSSTPTVLDQSAVQQLTSLVVNPQQTVAIDFGNLAGGLNLSGNLTNNGSIYAYSTNPNVTVGSFNANNIYNNAGGLITSVLPTGGIPGLSMDVSSLVSNFSLNLTAINNIVNAGTIASAGSLSLAAGGTITNAATQANMAALLSAVNNVNLMASNIVNSGVIAAMQGNINIASQLAQHLTLNNIAGQLQAYNGSINLRDINFAGKYNTSLTGGDFLSKELNIFSGNGIANIYAKDISALVNISAGEAHVTAATENLRLGSMIITGDPSIFNLAGDVTISGTQSFAGQPLSIVAYGNIVSAAGAGAISTANNSGAGGNILMVAGANFTADASNNLTILGASSSGGFINLSSTPITSLTAASTGGGGSGGNVTLIAYTGLSSNSGAGSGTITLPTGVAITSGGNGTGTNGNVLIVAGAAGTTAVTTGAVNASGGAASTGNISIYTSTPTINGGGSCSPCVTINGSGAVTGGSFDATRDTFNAVIAQTASISTGNLTAGGSTIDIVSGYNASIGTAGAGSNAIINNGSSGGGTTNITVNSPRTLLINSSTGPNNVNGLIVANATGTAGQGGKIFLTNNGTGGITLTAPTNLSVLAGSTSGNGGTISLSSPGGTVTIPTGNLNANASAGATGGAGGTLTLNASTVTITGAGPLNMNAAANVNGKGGTISVTASGAASTLTVNQTAAGALNLWAVGGATSGDGGSVTLIAGGALNFTDSGASNNPVGSGSGGSYYLQSGAAGNGVISYNGSFTDSNAVGTGSGGNITLITNSSIAFDMGSNAGGNGFSGIIHAHAATSGAGGKITIQNLGSGGITVSDLSVFDVQQAGSGLGGEVSLLAPTGPINITPASGTLGGTTLQGAGSGKGGSITMVSTTLSLTNNYILNVNGGSSGSGGSVSITTLGSTGSIAVGSSSGQFDITANGGSGASVIGGNIRLSAGQNLTITAPASNLTVAPTSGTGGSLTLIAGTAASGNLSVSAALSANAGGTGSGGSITIITNSTTAFNTNSNSGGNGVTGGITANAAGTGSGGSISITNLQGGITVSSLTSVSATAATTGKGGSLSLFAPFGAITITPASGTLGGATGFNGIGTTGGGGLISMSAGSFSLTNNYTLSVNSGASAITGGTVSLTTTGQAAPLTIGSGSGAFAISATGGTNSTTPTNISVLTAGNLTITSASLSTTQSSGRGPNIVLTAGVTGSGFIAVTGGLSANGVTSGSGGTITLTMNTTNVFNVGGGGTGTTAAITANAVGTGNGGTISINNLGTAGGISLSSLANVSVNSSTSGDGGNLTLYVPFGTLTLPSAGNLSANASGSNFKGGSIFLQSSAISYSSSGVLTLNANAGTGTANGGSISVVTGNPTSDITVGSSSGNIALSARGGLTGGDGGIIFLSAGRNLTIDPSGTNFVVGPQAGTGKGADITFRADSAGAGTVRITGTTSFSANGLGSGNGGKISISSGNIIDLSALSSLSVNGGTSGSGGQLSLETSSFSYPASAALAINANGNSSGNGGIITISTTNAAVSVGSSAGNISISAVSGASGGNGGQVTISSGQGLTINAASLSLGPQGTNGNGAVLALSAGTTDTNILTLTGSLLGLSGAGTGLAGQLTLTSAHNGTLTIGNATIAANAGSTSNGNGGQILITSGTGSLTMSNTALSANGAGTGAGGLISLTGGSTSIASGTITAAAGATSGNGGQLTLSSTILSISGGTLALSANGTGTGNGGSISIASTSTFTGFAIGSASGNLTISAVSGAGGGNGGTVSLVSGWDLSIDPSGGNLNIGPQGSYGNGALLTLSAGRNLAISSTLSVNGIGAGSGGSVSINTSSVTTFTIGSSTTNGVNGNITANAGSTYGSSGGSIAITNNGSGGITLNAFNNLSVAGASGGGTTGSITLKAINSLLTLPSGTWNMSATAGTSPSPGVGSGNFDGGKLTLQGNTLSFSGTLTLNADAVASGNGGNVSITTTTNLASTVTIGVGSIVVSAQGGSAGSSMGNGGTIAITASQNLIVNTPSSSLLAGPLGRNGNGANISLVAAGQNLFISGSSLSVNASQSAGAIGYGGSITLVSNSNTVFNVAAGATINGFDLAAPAITAAGGAGSGAGGSITIRNISTGGISISAGNSLTVTPVSGKGGTIVLDTSNGVGGVANGAITLPGNATINVNAVSASGDFAGGNYVINGSTVTTSSANPVTIQARGINFGNGGAVSVTAASGGLTINSTAAVGNIIISAVSGTNGGNGGSVNLKAGGNITITTPNSNLNVAPAVNGNGGSITLNATNVVVNTSGFTTVTQGMGFGAGGTVSITTNSSTAFNVGTAGTNGIAGGINVSAGSTSGNAGSISIINNGGGITVGAVGNLTATASSGGGRGGSITLTANGALSLPTGTYAVNSVGNNVGGQLNFAGTSLTVSGGTLLTLQGNGSGTGNGGAISLNTGSTAVTVGASNVNMSANGGTNLSDSGDAGSLTIISTGNLTVASASLSARPLGTNGAGGTFNLTGANVAITGALSAAGSGIGAGGQINITSNSSSAFNIGGGTGASGTNGSNAAITANGGNGVSPSGVNGGAIAIRNNGSGGITLPSIANISVNPSGQGGAGGTLQFTATQSTAVLSLPNGTFSVNAIGTGDFNAGKIIINVGQVSVGSGAPLLLAANATGAGAGGTVSVTTTNSTSLGALTIGSASQNLQISAFGGAVGTDSSGTAIANGQITLSAANALNINLSNINAAGPDSVNGNGASLTLAAGTGAPANLQVTNGSIIADATGNGIAGNVSITYNSASPFVIGGTITASGISGNISASTAGTGRAGSVSITNTNASALNVTLTGNISANSALGAPGQINFTPASGQAVNSVSGAGYLNGTVNAGGTSVTINPQTSGAALILGTIATTTGNATLTNNIGGAAVFMSATGSITSGGTGQVSVTGGTVTFYGLVSAATSATISSSGISSVSNVSAANGAVTITGVGNMQILPGSTVASNNGNIKLQNTSTTTGTVTIGQAATLNATEGNLTIENDNTSSGTIAVAANATLSASTASTFLGSVYVVIGPPPAVPVAGTAPANTVATATNLGLIYFGTNSISDTAPTNNVNANGGIVIFNTGSRPASAINLGGSVTVNSTTGSQLLTSLDLTDPAVTSQIINLQTTFRAGGTLTVNGGGVATGGNAIITPSNLASSLTAQNIPASVTLTQQGFTALNPITINITAASHTTQVIISGTNQFLNSGASNAVITVNSNQAGPVVLMNSTGVLSSDGNLSLTANGNMTINAAMPVASTGTLSLATTGNGSIALGANIGTVGATTNLQVSGSGTISQSAGRVFGSLVNLSSDTGNIFGTSNSPSTPILTTATNTLTVNTTAGGSGSAYVSNAGAISIGTSLVGNSLQIATTGANAHLTNSGTVTANTGLLQLSANGNLTTSYALSGNTLNMQTTSGSGAITLNADAVGTNGATVSCCASTFTIAAGQTLSTSNAAISITATDIVLSGSVNAGTSTVSLIPCTNSQAIRVGGATAVGGSFNATASNLNSITASAVTIGSASGTGGITLAGNLTMPASGTPGVTAGLYDLNLLNGGAGGTYNGSGNSINMQGESLTITTAGALNTGAGSILTSTGVINLTGAGVTIGTGGISQSGASTINIATPGASTANITFNGTVSTAAGGTVNVTSNSSGNIVDGTGVGGTAVAGGSLVVRATGTGSVGSAGTPFSTTATNLTANATGGSVFINNTSSSTVNLQNAAVGGTQNAAAVTYSVTAAQNLTTVDSFGTIRNVSLVSTNGVVDLTGILSTGTISNSGGNFTVSAGTNIVAPGDVSPTTLNTTGAAGTNGTSGGAGTIGGNITLTAGTISNSGFIDLPNLTLTSNGGQGGTASSSGNTGGLGGNGGTVSVSATGAITLAAINNNGGLGGNNTSTSGGTGGRGGNGGSTTVNSTVSGAVTLGALSVAGALGGNGSSSGSNGTGGRGGNGGTLTVTSNSGTVGITGNLSTAGANGGPGATQGIGGTGGNQSITTTNFGSIAIVGNLTSSGGTGSTVGQPGAITVSANSNFAGQGFAGPSSPVGINGYIVAQAGGTSRSAINGTAGIITLSGNDVAIYGTTLNVSGTNYSIYGGRLVNITSPGAKLPQNYSSASNLSSTNIITNPITAVGFDAYDPGATFTLGTSGSTGNIASRINGTNDTITINTSPNAGHPAARNILDSSPQVFTGGSAVFTYKDSANVVHSVTQSSSITAAELIALIQTQYSSSQTLIVDTTSTPIATGGSFNIAAVNFPTATDNGGNFSTLVIPASVTANVVTTTIIPANGSTVGPITVSGTLSFNAISGGSSGGINAAGNITTAGTGIITSSQTGTVSLTSTANSIGSLATPLAINLSNLTLNAANGSVFANNQLAAGDITIGNSSANSSTGSFCFNATTTSGNILSASSTTISASKVGLSTANGNIGTATSLVSLNTPVLSASAPNGSSYITDSARVTLQDCCSIANGVSASGIFYLIDTNNAGAGTTAIAFSGPTAISAGSLVLRASVSGDIGSAGTPIVTTAGNITANAVAGSVYINDTSSANVNLQNTNVNGVIQNSASVVFSLTTSQSLTTVNAFSSIRSVALTSTNAAVDLTGTLSSGTISTNGGSFTVSAGTDILAPGDITPTTLNTTGTNGSNGTSTGGNGTIGGAITLTAGTGSGTGTINLPNLSLVATGSNGGTASSAGGTGGQGGAGGTISISTPGSITLSAITSNGGTGGNNTNASGGTGGLGGNAGSVTINSTNSGTITLGALSASGSVGGNGSSGSVGIGGKGGNGGSLTVTSASGAVSTTGNITTTGANGGTGTTQGNGGTGGAQSITTTNLGSIAITGNLTSSGGTGPTVGQPGAITVSANTNYAGLGLGGPASPVGINGYILAQAGGTSRSALTAGAGAINLSGNAVAIYGTPINISGTNYSIYGGSSITINSPGANLPQNYASASNLGSTNIIANPITATGFSANNPSATFTLGTSGSKGNIASRINGTADTITINTAPNGGHPAAHNILDSSPQVFTGGTVAFIYKDNNNVTHTVNASSSITAAELVALIQTQYLGTQTLIVDGSATPIAIGGSFNIAAVNFPTATDNGGNFSTLIIPAGVTANVTTTTLIPANGSTIGPITVNGTLSFNAISGGSSGGINAAGNITTSGAGLITSSQTGTVSLTSTANSIGSLATPLAVSLSNLALNAANGSVFANNQLASGDITLNNSSANASTGSFCFTATITTGNILTAVGNTISANRIGLSSSNGNIGTAASPTAVNTPILSSYAPNGSSFITDSAKVTLQDCCSLGNGVSSSGIFYLASTNNAGAGVAAISFAGPTAISAGTLVLRATVSGDIGSSGTPIVTTAGNLTANAASGSVYLNNTSSGNVNLQSTNVNGTVQNSASNTFSLTTSQNLTTVNAFSTIKNVTLTSTNGSVDLSGTVSSGTVNTNGGNFIITAGTNIIAPSNSTPVTINNSSSGANGGSFTLTAGTTSAGGIINIPNISLTSGGGTGNINLTATAGTTNNGNITTAALTTTGANGTSGATGTAGFQGGNVTINGKAITTGAITLNGGTGGASSAASGGIGGLGGVLTISAAGNSSIGAITNNGGVGGQSMQNLTGSTGGIGGAGGDVIITSSTGTLSVGAIQANGGNGGSQTTAGQTGGVGGAGGDVTITATAGLTVTSASTNGGTGGSETSATTGKGGAGGLGGTLSLVSASSTVTSGTVTALGGAGGNASGTAGIGGNGNLGGNIAVESHASGVTITGNVDSSGGLSGTGAGGNGTPGQPAGNADDESILIAGVGAVSISGYVAASAGGSSANVITAINANITLLGKTVALPATGTALFGGAGGYNAYGGSGMTIISPGVISSLTQYSSNGDLSANAGTVPMVTFTGQAFVVGTTPLANSMGAAFALGTKSGGILSINGTNAANPVNGSSPVRSFQGNLVVIYNGNDFLSISPSQNVTPAQWVAAVQVAAASTQIVTLNPNGAGDAIANSFTLSDANYPLITPAGGTTNTFTNIYVPEGVTAFVTATSANNAVTSSGNVTINGILNYQAGSSGTLSATGTGAIITANGTITTASGPLTVSATGSGSSLVITSTGTISATSGNVTVQSPTINNNGLITSSNANGITSVQNSGALTLTGSGLITQTGSGIPSIVVQTTSAAAINMNGNWTFNAGSSGTVTLRAQISGASINVGAGTTQTIAGGSALTVSAPQLAMGAGSQIASLKTSGTGITVNNGTLSAPVILIAPSGSSATIGTQGANISISPSFNQTLTFDKSATTLGTLNLNTQGLGSVTMTTNANTTINALTLVQTDSNVTMNVNGGNSATINGGLTTSMASANLLIQSSTSLTLAGTGSLSVTGGGSSYITVQAQGANPLTVSASLTYNADFNTFVQLQSKASGGSVIVGSGTTQTINGSAYGQLIAPQITFNGAATVNNSGGYLDLTGDQLSTSITLTNNTNVTLNVSGGVTFIGSYASQALVINKTAGANSATLQINNEVQTFSYGANTTIAAGVILSSNNNITVSVDGGMLTTNGTITTSAVGGTIALGSLDANTTLAGTPQGITATGGGGSVILVQAGGIGHTLAINGSQSFNAGTDGSVTFIADTLSMNTSITASSTSSPLAFFGQNVNLNGGAVISGTNSVSFFASGGSNTLTITSPDATSAQIVSSSGQIVFQGQSIVFAKSSGGNTTFLNLNNSPTYIQSVGGNVTINPSVTVRSNNDITLQANNGVSFNINGTLESTKNGGLIDISGTAGMTIAGSSTGTIKVSGSGANSIRVIGFDSGLTLNNSLILDAGAAGTALIGAAVGSMTMAAGKTINFANSTQGNVQATTLLLSGNNTITGSKTSGTALNIFSSNPNPFTLNLQATTSSTFATGGGSINVFSPKNVTIGISGGTPTDTATLNFTGGPATITSNQGTTVISSRVIINSQNNITFNVNQITVGSSGQINTSLGSITLIAATGTISIGNNVTMYANEGNLTIQNTDTSGGTINIASGANLTGFTLSNPGLGFVNIVVGPIPSMPTVGSVPANVIVNESGGGIVYFGTNSINAAAPNNTINAKGRNVVFNTGGQGASAITLGGNVTITADPPEFVASDTTSSSKQFAFTNLNTFLPADSTNLNSHSIATTVIPFDTSPSSTVQSAVGDDTINNYVRQALTQSGVLHKPTQDNDDDNDDNNPYEPISYSPSVVRNKRFVPATHANGLYTLETDNAFIKCTNGARVSIKQPTVVTLKSGEALIATTRGKQQIAAGSYTVRVNAQATVVVSFENNVLKVANIYDKSPSSVQVETAGGTVSLGVGEELIIAPDEDTIAEAMQSDKLGRRNIKSHNLHISCRITHSEISLVSLLENNATVNQLVLSHDRDDRALANCILKTAACLMLSTAKHGPYQSAIQK